MLTYRPGPGDREELDGFDGYEPHVPPDISSSEHEALVALWSALGGRRWRRGEKWRYSDASDWEGVTVRGGEAVCKVPEELIEKAPLPSGEKPPPGPRLRKGDPMFQKVREPWAASFRELTYRGAARTSLPACAVGQLTTVLYTPRFPAAKRTSS